MSNGTCTAAGFSGEVKYKADLKARDGLAHVRGCMLAEVDEADVASVWPSCSKAVE